MLPVYHGFIMQFTKYLKIDIVVKATEVMLDCTQSLVYSGPESHALLDSICNQKCKIFLFYPTFTCTSQCPELCLM